MDPDPYPTTSSLVYALLPALTAAAYATVTATLGSLSAGRRAALKESLSEGNRAALERYQESPERIEARWLWLRVTGVAATAALLTSRLEGITVAGAPVAPWIVALGTAILTYAVPSEMARPFATTHAERVVGPLLRVLRPLEWVVAPLSDPLSALARNLAGERQPSATLTETEVEIIVNEGEQNGSLAHDQSEMIRNVLDFGDLRAEDVMVPRVHVDAIDGASSFDDVMKFVLGTKHSRYPVYQDTIDGIVGILHVKDLFALEAGSSASIVELARKPVVFVPEGQQASIVLRDMRAGRHHLAVVIDEFGGFSGIVTLEDLLEEIVGDIQDEHDLDDAARITPLEGGRALVDASLPVTDVNRHLGTELPEGDYVSLAGLLLAELGRVPQTGTVHELFGHPFTIRESDRRRIARVEIGGLPAESTQPSSESGSNAAA